MSVPRQDPPSTVTMSTFSVSSRSQDPPSREETRVKPVMGRMVASSSQASSQALPSIYQVEDFPHEGEDRHHPDVLYVDAKLMQDEDVENQAMGAANSALPVNSNEEALGDDSEGEVDPEENKDGRHPRKYQYWIVAAIGVVVVLAIVLGLALGLTGGDNDKKNSDAPFFQQVGSFIDGDRTNNYLGSALATSRTGHRIAVASPGAVKVYELIADKWQQLGQEIVISNSTEGKRLELTTEGFVTVAMNSGGERIVTGYSDANNETGLVQVYQYNSISWMPVGKPLTGLNAGDRFGAAISMNADGDVIAVGAPGHESSKGKVVVFQRDSDKQYRQLGSIIPGDTRSTVSEFGRSVSLSAVGERVAAAARSFPNGLTEVNSPVVKVFQYNRYQNFKWTALGEAVSAGTTTASTGWYVSLSNAGDRMVVSNSYLNEDDFINLDSNSLVVQAFQFENENWKQLGGNMHGNISGPKSGYLVTFSDDGTKIGMGDPGTSGGGRGRGHAHIYQLTEDDDWMQIGPNIEGQGRLQSNKKYESAVFPLWTDSVCLNSFLSFSPFQRMAIDSDLLWLCLVMRPDLLLALLLAEQPTATLGVFRFSKSDRFSARKHWY